MIVDNTQKATPSIFNETIPKFVYLKQPQNIRIENPQISHVHKTSDYVSKHKMIFENTQSLALALSAKEFKNSLCKTP